MNSKNKDKSEGKKMDHSKSESKSPKKSSSHTKSNIDSADLRKQVSDLAATGASIAIRKAVDASLANLDGGKNDSRQMDGTHWRKLAVWIAISGVAIGVAKLLSSDMVDDIITEYLGED